MPRFLRPSPVVVFFVFALLAGAVASYAQERADRGAIAGTVFDATSGQPLLGVEVSVVDQPYRASTDLAGRFRIVDLPPGVHVVEFRLEKFANGRVADVTVEAGATATVEARLAGLPEDIQLLDEMTVRSEAARAGSRQAALEERRNIAVSMDQIGKEELGKLAVSDVSEAMVRLPGVNVASRGSFVVIRGLAERYNSATFNGIVLPSSDPERQSVELDQIPTRLIEGLAVYKNFAPDLPGNLSGGGVDVRTVLFPDKDLLSLTVGASLDDGRFHDRPFLSYATARPGDGWARGARGRATAEDLRATVGADRLYAADPAVPFAVSRHQLPHGKKLGVFFGRTFRFGENRRLGISAGLAYDSSFATETGEFVRFKDAIRIVRNGDDGYRLEYTTRADNNGVRLPPDSYRYERSKEKVQLGALASVAYQINDAHRVRFTAFTSQTGNDVAQYDFDQVQLSRAPFSLEALGRLPAGEIEDRVAERFQQTLHYRERNLTHLALQGTHRFPGWRDFGVTWSAARNSTYQDEPDRRSYSYYRFYRTAQFENPTIERTWRKLEETQDNYQFTAGLPVRVWGGRDAKLAVGGEFNRTERTYAEDSTYGGLEQVIVERPEQISPYVRQTMSETPVSVDLRRRLGAAFAKVDLPIRAWLDFSGGVRWDYTEITGQGYGVFPTQPNQHSIFLYFAGDTGRAVFWDKPWQGLNDNPVNRAIADPKLKQWNVLPSAILTARPTRSTIVRLAASQTVARPSIREMSNYFSEDEQGRVQHGNGFLVNSKVRNYDARWEYFVEGTTDLVAVSVFYKEITDPIEKVQLPLPIGGGEGRESITDMWFNNPAGATVRGAEFEFRKGLGFLGDRWSAWSIGGNATRIDARTTAFVFLGNPAAPAQQLLELPAWRSQRRRLYDQPEWLANGDVSWESKAWGTAVTVSATATDSVLAFVPWDGTQLATYLAGTTRWDCTLRQKFGRRWSVKLSGKNLSDPERKYVRDPKFLGAIGAELVDRRWHDGRSYTLTTTCEF